jgi:hypothetical protein
VVKVNIITCRMCYINGECVYKRFCDVTLLPSGSLFSLSGKWHQEGNMSLRANWQQNMCGRVVAMYEVRGASV